MTERALAYDVRVFASLTCPHVDRTLLEVDRAVRVAGIPPERVRVRRVTLGTEAEAREAGVSGSPTVRVNGFDVDPGTSRPHLGCREYVDEDRRSVDYPPAFLIADVLRRVHAPHPEVDEGEVFVPRHE